MIVGEYLLRYFGTRSLVVLVKANELLQPAKQAQMFVIPAATLNDGKSGVEVLH